MFSMYVGWWYFYTKQILFHNTVCISHFGRRQEENRQIMKFSRAKHYFHGECKNKKNKIKMLLRRLLLWCGTFVNCLFLAIFYSVFKKKMSRCLCQPTAHNFQNVRSLLAGFWKIISIRLASSTHKIYWIFWQNGLTRKIWVSFHT